MRVNPFETQLTSDIGQPTALVSETGNHPPSAWAVTTTKQILDVSKLTGDRLNAGLQLQSNVIRLLSAKYTQVIAKEIDDLSTYPDHCDTDYDVADIAKQTIDEIRGIAKGSLWHDLIHAAEWASSAWLTIASHFSTAIHVERLLFADRTPNNQAAVNYQRRFQQG